MTNDEYKQNMDSLANSLRSAHVLASTVSDDDLDVLEETIERAESVGFLFVKPATYQRGIVELREQRKVIDLHRRLRAFWREVEKNHSLKGGTS